MLLMRNHQKSIYQLNIPFAMGNIGFTIFTKMALAVELYMLALQWEIRLIRSSGSEA